MHIRVSAIIVNDGRLLLLPHRYRKGILWHLPGGKINVDETLEDALIRELYEELKIRIQVKQLSFICMEYQEKQADYILHLTFRSNQILSDKFPIQLDDSNASEIQFVPLDKLQDKILYPNIGDELIKYLQPDADAQICHYLGIRKPRSWL